MPVGTSASREEFQKRAGTALFNDAVKFVRLARVLALLRADDVHLAAAWGERSKFSANAEQNKFRRVAKVEANATTVRSAVFADFVPDNV